MKQFAIIHIQNYVKLAVNFKKKLRCEAIDIGKRSNRN